MKPLRPKSPASRPARPWRSLCISVVTIATVSCARHQPRWTPESVAPPENLDAALARVQAQEPPAAEKAVAPTKPAPGAAEPAENKEAVEQPIVLTRDGAILSAVAGNRSLAVERYEIDISRTSIKEARAAFDPSVQASVAYREQNRPGATSSSSGGASSGGGTSTAAATTATDGEDGEGTTTSTAFPVLTTVATLAEELAELKEQIVELSDDHIETTRGLDSSMTLSEYLPTGTELFLTGGVTRSGATSMVGHEYEGTWSIGVTQSLLRGFGTGVNLVELRQSRNSAASTEHAVRDAALDLVKDVEDGYWDLVLAKETLAIREFSMTLAQGLLALNEAQISVGKLAKSARVSAVAAVASSKADLVDAEADVRSRAIALWRLMNPEWRAGQAADLVCADSPEVVCVTTDPEPSIALADLYRPDLAQARLSLANSDLEVVRTKNGLLPRLDLSASYGRYSEGVTTEEAGKFLDDSDYDSFEIGLDFEMSLTNRAERAQNRRAKFQREQAEAAIWNLEQAIETEVRQTAVEVEREWERVKATQEEVRNREEEFRIEQDQFRLGRSTNLDVLQVQESLVNAKVDEVTARVGYIKALTALYHTEGTLLDRRGVGLAACGEEDK